MTDSTERLTFWFPPVSRGIVTIPKSTTKERIVSNFNTVALDQDDIKKIDQIHESGTERFNDPQWGFDLKWNETK